MKTQIVPVTPTIEMLMAGRKQCMADMLSAHMGPNIENIWRAMVLASPTVDPHKATKK